MIEAWKPMKNYEQYYLISNLGNIKTIVVNETRKRPYSKKERVFNKRLSKEGYYRTALTVNGNVKYFQVHRLVAENFISNPNNYPVINHIDGNKLNNSVDNLEWTTSSLNQRHAYDTGLKSKKLTQEQKQEIIQLRETGLTYFTIADKFNVSYQLIHQICKPNSKTVK